MRNDLFGSAAERFVDGGVRLMDGLGQILGTGGRLPADLAAWGERIIDGDPSLERWCVDVAAVCACFVALSWSANRIRGRVSRRTGPVYPTYAAAKADLVCYLAVVIVALSAKAAWFFPATPLDAIASSSILAFVEWRTVLLPLDIVLRPRRPDLRLVLVDDTSAERIHARVAGLAGLILAALAILRGMRDSDLPLADLQLLALILGSVSAVAAILAIDLPWHDGDARSGDTEGGRSRLPGKLERLWRPIGNAFVAAAATAWFVGVVVTDLSVFWSLSYAAGIVIVAGGLRSVVSHRLGVVGARDRTGRHAVIERCISLALGLAAAVACAEVGIAAVSHVAVVALWDRYAESVIAVAATVYLAYVLSQVLLLWVDDRLVAPQGPIGNGGQQAIATRLQTMLPVLRLLLLVIIVTVATLTVLSTLGVNTTSILAGTSIVGLAISFGSQSLVHDIVSGVFYMADDAFRIGEYIDTGKLKGTVEGMSIRSLRLRHQNGQVHTIPFGQIHQVTNFSRDWQTVKFNLQLVHGTDIDKVRKIVKQIGAEMTADPELGPEIITPLKLQGIADIDPNAVVVRLKFIARPSQPTTVLRDALRRLYEAFGQQGIVFAANSVLQIVSGTEMPSGAMVHVASDRAQGPTKPMRDVVAGVSGAGS